MMALNTWLGHTLSSSPPYNKCSVQMLSLPALFLAWFYMAPSISSIMISSSSTWLLFILDRNSSSESFFVVSGIARDWEVLNSWSASLIHPDFCLVCYEGISDNQPVTTLGSGGQLPEAVMVVGLEHLISFLDFLPLFMQQPIDPSDTGKHVSWEPSVVHIEGQL